ncbi:tetratricopeptide repeat protein [Acidithiobacillus sp. M4-SHS-6]|uniref:tetratricopeptide repeat protein n=1 Tax=Acidithiobacillus sp. M4-SHS-6 TaxID=3383024 RepID=UPI0039BE76E9
MTISPSDTAIFVSTQTAALLTGKSIRTIHNWLGNTEIAGKDVPAGRIPGGAAKKIDLVSLAEHIPLTLTDTRVAWIIQADAGQPEAMKMVGLSFHEVDNYPLAVAWFEAAAKKGEADAMDLLSWHYINGSGVKKNIPVGVLWLAKAAELGLPTALIKLQQLGFDVGPVPLKEGVAFSPTDVHLHKKAGAKE